MTVSASERSAPPTQSRLIVLTNASAIPLDSGLKAVAVIEALANGGHAETAVELAELLNEGVPHATALCKRIGMAVERILNREQP